jgi:hypothetical protein
MDYAPSLDFECGDGAESRNATDVRLESAMLDLKDCGCRNFKKTARKNHTHLFHVNALVHGYNKRLNLTLVQPPTQAILRGSRKSSEDG